MDSSAGEAATLFGATDSADPFAAALGGNTGQADQHTGSGGETSHAQGSSVASELFNGNADDVDFFNTAGTLNGSGSGQDYGAAMQPTHGYEASAGGRSTTMTAADYSQQYQAQGHQQNGWHGAYQPATGYTQQPQAYSTTAYGTASNPYTSAYDPYASYGATTSSSAIQPTSTSAAYNAYNAAAQPALSSYTSQITSDSVQQASYDPYKPAQPVCNPYIPAQSADSSSGPYRPPAANPAASYSATVESSYAYSLTSTAAQPTFAVPPPAPGSAPSAAAAAPYRPKTSNAYDPPLPPPKAKKRLSSHVIYSGSPPAGQRAALSPPPPQGPPKKTESIPSDGYAPSAPSLYHPPPVERYASPQQSVTYSDMPHAVQNGHASTRGVAPDAGHLNHDVPAPHAPMQGHREWDGMPQSTYPSFSPNPTVSPPLPAAVPQQVPLSPALPSEEGLVGAEHGSDRYAPSIAAGRSVSPPAIYANQSTYWPDTRELSRVASPPQGATSPWSTGSVPINDSTSPAHHRNAYEPSQSAPDRTTSPGIASVRSVKSIHMHSLEQPHQTSLSKSPVVPSRKLTADSRYKTPVTGYDPPIPETRRAISPPARVSPNAYDLPSITDARRAASPPAVTSRPPSVVTGGIDPYAPGASSRMRSMSNGSVLSSISAVLEDPYVPSRHVRQQTGDSIRSNFDVPSNAYATHAPAVHDGSAQVLNVSYPGQTMYAPSPSLLGANDPLGRTSVRVPVVSFGFGGKFVTCFHGTSASGGFDVALASRQSSEIKLHTLHNVIPESALDTSAAAYPGPLFSDPGTPTTSLVRTAAATQTKTKKARVVKYLEERADELNRGLGYFHSGSLEGRRAEGKHILVKLLKVMVENDGRLSGSSQIDAAVRSALSSRAAQPPPDALQIASSISADMQSPSLVAASPYLSLPGSHDPADAVIATHTLRWSHLDKIQDFLMKGERRAASHYASDQKLWAHAMIIASSIDKEAWKDVVTEFVRTELASQPRAPGSQTKAVADGREALRVAYSLFAGHGSGSIQELVTPKPLAPTMSTLHVPLTSTSSVTPVSASFPGPSEPMDIPSDVLAKWADTVAMIYSSPLTFETSSALTALGDQLAASHWYEAAHACYLLSPQTSPTGGIGSSSRVVLLGSPSPSVALNFAKDPDPFIFSEIAEFALSLTPPAKGQESFSGLPHLQPYRLIRAASLAEMGHVQLANRYCEAISNCLKQNSLYINSTFLEQLKGLNDRLIAAPQLDKSGSWITSKVSKPSLDGIGSWVGGRLTKFIAGEDSPGPDKQSHGPQQQPFGGPFSQYSTISSTASSAAPSPHQSTVNLSQTMSSPPPLRAESAAGLRAPAAPQINRASSAMDYTRPSLSRKPSPVPRVASANPTTTTFADASLYSQALNGHAFGSNSKQSLNGYGNQDDQSAADSDSPQSAGPALGSWWGSSDTSATTPTASSFMPNDESSISTATSGQFISLMDDFSVTPTAYQAKKSFSSNPTIDDDDDDLGLGNTQRAKRQASEAKHKNESGPAPATEEPKEEAKPTEEKSASSGGWLSRLWKRESTPTPVKANLGEQTSFVYDKDLKRWVNKNAGAEAAKPAQPPPPPRAQTTSPGTSMRALPSGTTPPPPPARPATTDPGDGLPKPPMRIRSNLVPPESDGSAPPTPMSATLPGQGPPPASRSRGAAKRPARSRYVDVFAQQQQGS